MRFNMLLGQTVAVYACHTFESETPPTVGEIIEFAGEIADTLTFKPDWSSLCDLRVVTLTGDSSDAHYENVCVDNCANLSARGLLEEIVIRCCENMSNDATTIPLDTDLRSWVLRAKNFLKLNEYSHEGSYVPPFEAVTPPALDHIRFR